MRLLVIGAAGRTGRHVVDSALATGHVVTAFVRRPDALDSQREGLTVVRGDVLDPASVTSAMKGQEAVASVVGVKGRGQTTVFSAGMANVLDAMAGHGVRRVVALSTAGLDPDVEMPLAQRLVSRYIVARILRNLYQDQARMEAALEASDTDWTIVRATLLTDRPATGNYRVSVGGELTKPERIGRADLAAYIVSGLAEPETFREKVMISY